MPPTPWKPNVNLLAGNSPLTAGNLNTPSQDLTSRDEYLKEQFDNAELGQALKAKNQACSSDVLIGSAVYWNDEQNRYEPAIAAIDASGSSNPVSIAKSSYAVGIVESKSTATLCDIVLLGKAAIDLTNVVTDPDVAGALYLSASFPGKLTLQQPPVSIYIGYNQGNGDVVVAPTPREILNEHIHYKFELETRPAGAVSVSSNLASFGCSDYTLTGWLPVNSPVWAANNIVPPVGAYYGYNIFSDNNIDKELRSIFPPIPTGTVYLEINGVGVDPALYTINKDGIWWFSNCASTAAGTPWGDTGNVGSCPSTFTAERRGAQVLGCPLTLPRRMCLWFTKMVYKTQDSVVASLIADAPITVTSAVTNAAASVGNLKLTLDLDLDSGSNLAADEEVGYAFKLVDSENNAVLRKGKVVTDIINGSPSTLDTTTNADGSITLTVASLTDTLSGQVQLVALNNVREEIYNNIPYLSMPSGIDSSMLIKINVPRIGISSKTKVQLFGWMTATVNNQTLPNIGWSCVKLSEPTGCSAGSAESMLSPVSFGSGSNLLCGVNNSSLLTQFTDAYDYTLAATTETGDNVTYVAPGDTLIFNLYRTGSSDNYVGDVGFINLYYKLNVVT